ncbi:ROK family protein [Paenibacillus riograndensis]|uniref:Transcriptional regulator n=1 Tax=Paenibacillus riograndensis SBR5 TaxID=1073571 RepID=A0A0E4HBF9_9BACL|nr:ROK family protein [Paenibacillus riograndensis]CQR53390.1 transcriptional regulator [Paenibacillus riograndensis SBR5]
MTRCYIGADIGGTGIKAAVIDERGGIITRSSRPTPVADGAKGILLALKGVISGLLADGPEVSGIGIGTAGRVDPEEGVVLYATDNLPGWTGMRLAAEIEAEFALPAAVQNDANAAALGEGWLGAALGLADYAMLTLGTGVGGALVHKNQPVSGKQGAAGEFGHMVLYPGGIPCSCGQSGCTEHYLSGRALNRLAAGANEGWDSRRLLAAFAAGDPGAAAVMEVYMNDLSLTVHNIQSFFDPGAIILGGGVAESHPLWWVAWLDRLTAASPLSFNVLPARLGNEAGIIGAARMIMMREME